MRGPGGKGSWRRFLTAVALGLGAVGCSASGSLEETVAISRPLADYSILKLSVTVEDPEDAEGAALVEAKLGAGLSRAGIFDRVLASDVDLAEPDLVLRAHIVNLRRVSSASRAMGGALVGRGKLEIQVELIDVATGESIGELTAEGKSSGGTIFAGTTTQGVDQAVDRVIEYLVQHAGP